MTIDIRSSKTVCNDYVGFSFERQAIKHQDAEDVEPFDSILDDDYANKHLWEGRLGDMQHIVSLARSNSRDGYWILYDTRDGQITLVDFQNGGGSSHDPKVLFRDCKEVFRGLVVFPTEASDVQMSRITAYPDRLEEVHDVFRKHGWCTPHYSKEKCMTEVEKLWRSFRG